MPVIDDAFLATLSLEPLAPERNAEQEEAFTKVKRWALVRERGTHELVERLMRDDYSREDAQAAVQRAVDCGLVSDIRYGEALVRGRISKGKGRHGIEQELERAGIAPSSIPGWPEEFFGAAGQLNDGADYGDVSASEDVEFERAMACLRRKPPRSKNPQASAYRSLVSKGYASSVASRAAREFVANM